jgi:uncharacterized membrane protein HdeD (DUF308 family)
VASNCRGEIHFADRRHLGETHSKEGSMSTTASDILRRATTFSLAWGIALMILGILAIALPLATAVAVAVMLSWLIIVAGIVHLVYAFETRGAKSVLWQIFVGIVYLVGGLYLLFNPLLAAASLALVIAAMFFVESIFDFVAFFRTRGVPGSLWFLLDGIVTLFLSIILFVGWPGNAIWAVGTIVGISLFFSGIARTMMAVTARRALSEAV